MNLKMNKKPLLQGCSWEESQMICTLICWAYANYENTASVAYLYKHLSSAILKSSLLSHMSIQVCNWKTEYTSAFIKENL